MGNTTSSRTEKYYNYLQNNKNGVPIEINMNDVNPYEVLGVSKNFTFEELKDAYRRIVKFVHPDKGGSEQLFNIATECFRTLARELKMREEKTHDELRKGSRDYWANAPTMPGPPVYTSERQESESYKYNPNSDGRGGSSDGGVGGGIVNESSANFNERFNRTFEANRLKEDDGTHDGYGEKMAKSTKEREDFKIPQLLKKYNNTTFNKVFDTVTLQDTKEVVKYIEPEALPLAKTLQYTELGGASRGDFSSTSEGEARKSLQYTDYMKAFTTTRLVDPRAVQERQNFKNVKEYESERANVMAKPETAEERAWRKQKEYEAQKTEEARLHRLKQRDAKTALHHEKVNRAMLQR